METKRLDYTKDSFTANGKTYFIRDTMTIERFMQWEKLQNHYAYGLTFQQIHDKVEQSIAFANKGKGVEAWNILFNLKEGIAYRLEDRIHPALMMCSLFMVTENEDLTKWDEVLAKTKVEDWKAEGIAMNDFFQFASNFTNGFIKIYNEIFQSISSMTKPNMSKKPTGKKS